MEVYSSKIEGVCEVLEFKPSSSPEEQFSFNIDVPDGPSAIILGAGDFQGNNIGRMPGGVEVSLTYPVENGEPRQVAVQTQTDIGGNRVAVRMQENNLSSLFWNQPPIGTWLLTIQVPQGVTDGFSVFVATFKGGLQRLGQRVGRFLGANQCRACRFASRAIISAVIAWAAAQAGVALLSFLGISSAILSLPPAAQTLLIGILGPRAVQLLDGVFRVAARELGEVVSGSVNWLAQKLCESLGLCQPQLVRG